jgi:hypothetical protein
VNTEPAAHPLQPKAAFDFLAFHPVERSFHRQFSNKLFKEFIRAGAG